MADVLPIRGHKAFERLERSTCARTLRDAIGAKPSEVLVIGTDAEGQFFVSGSPPDPERAMWLLERAKLHIFKVTVGG
jgi:hypothetical protein